MPKTRQTSHIAMIFTDDRLSNYSIVWRQGTAHLDLVVKDTITGISAVIDVIKPAHRKGKIKSASDAETFANDWFDQLAGAFEVFNGAE